MQWLRRKLQEIQALKYLIFLSLHLVLVLILRKRLWLQFSVAFAVISLSYSSFIICVIGSFTFSEEVVPQFLDEGFSSCGSSNCWSWNTGYTGDSSNCLRAHAP